MTARIHIERVVPQVTRTRALSQMMSWSVLKTSRSQSWLSWSPEPRGRLMTSIDTQESLSRQMTLSESMEMPWVPVLNWTKRWSYQRFMMVLTWFTCAKGQCFVIRPFKSEKDVRNVRLAAISWKELLSHLGIFLLRKNEWHFRDYHETIHKSDASFNDLQLQMALSQLKCLPEAGPM
jgi:hypothetical protein